MSAFRRRRGTPAPAALLLALSLGTVLSAGSRLLAHDLWIEPSAFLTESGRPLGLGLSIGHPQRQAEAFPRWEEHIDSFEWYSSGGTAHPVVAREGMDPAGLLRPQGPGPLVIRYVSRAFLSTLASEAFERYLEEKGLEAIAKERKQRGETHTEGREEYRRCLYSLVDIQGDEPEARLSTTAFWPPCVLRLIPVESDSSRADFRLEFRGRPVADALVEASPLERGDSLTARTDERGLVHFPLADGPWLLAAVHMERADPLEELFEWSTWWTSLTLQTPRR